MYHKEKIIMEIIEKIDKLLNAMKCDGCGEETHSIFIDKDHKKLCPKCYKKKYRGNNNEYRR